MKGIILAGGTGSRLRPVTLVTNKHLLPVYDRPMIYHPIETLKKSGISDIMIVCGNESAGDFMKLLGSGKALGVNLTYRIQDGAGGIAHALSLAKDFSEGDNIAVILGDNIFDFDILLDDFRTGARIHLKEVLEPNRFGVPKFKGNKIQKILEKPKELVSKYAVTGLYIYDKDVFDFIETLEPSDRGELEVTDLNNIYISEGKMEYRIIEGFWSDAGTFDSLLRASNYLKNKKK